MSEVQTIAADPEASDANDGSTGCSKTVPDTEPAQDCSLEIGPQLRANHGRRCKVNTRTPVQLQACRLVEQEMTEIRCRKHVQDKHRFIETELLDEDLFLSSVTLPAESAGKPPKDASGGISVKNSGRLAGVTVTVAQGAASISGRVAPAAPGSNLPDKLKVYLVPVDKEAADNTLRYYDAHVRRDGSFEIKHIAPGRYFALTRIMSAEEWDEINPRPIWWPASNRQKLRKEAETANITIEVKSCQQMKGTTIPYVAGANPSAVPAKSPAARVP